MRKPSTTSVTSEQMRVLAAEATRAGDAGIQELCNRALNVPLALSQPWAASAAREKCARLVADILRHDGWVKRDEWQVSAAGLDVLRVQP